MVSGANRGCLHRDQGDVRLRRGPNPAAGTGWSTTARRVSYTLAADPSNPANVSRPVTFQWSDFVPVTLIPQAAAPDGPHVLFIYITIGSPNMVKGGANWLRMADDPLAMGRRHTTER